MIRRLAAAVFSLMFVFLFLPLEAEAGNWWEDYFDYDFFMVQSFLEEQSAIPGKTNGECLNPNYDKMDPSTWTGVEWNSLDLKRVIALGKNNAWTNKSLSGGLNMAGCDKLTDVYCEDNQIEYINVRFTAVQRLYCGGNPVDKLDLSQSPSLLVLDCDNADLTELDFSKNNALAYLSVSDNHLTSLDVSNKSILYYLNCNENEISSLNISGSPKLQTLYCGGNSIPSLDTSTKTELENLYCTDNKIGSLDLRQCSKLKKAECGTNQLTSLQLGSNSSLTTLICSSNKLSELDISGLPNISSVICSDNLLTSLNTDNNAKISIIQCDNNKITKLDTSANPQLAMLTCKNNQLKSLDLGIKSGLSMQCAGNPLTHIFVKLDNTSIQVNAGPNGYVELYTGDASRTVTAVPHGGDFVEWEQAGNRVSAEKEYNLQIGTNFSLKANFMLNVTFDSNGGDSEPDPHSIHAAPGEKISPPGTGPARQGYTLSGWYTDKAGTDKWDFAANTVDENITLFAGWTATDPLALTLTPPDGRVAMGGQITVSANAPGGVWDIDDHFLQGDTSGEQVVLTAAQAGTVTIRYTLGEQTVTADVQIEATDIPAEATDAAAQTTDTSEGPQATTNSSGPAESGAVDLTPGAASIAWYWWVIIAAACAGAGTAAFLLVRRYQKHKGGPKPPAAKDDPPKA